MTKSEREPQEFEKERIELADGRELIYYRFKEPSKASSPPSPKPPSPKKA